MNTPRSTSSSALASTPSKPFPGSGMTSSSSLPALPTVATPPRPGLAPSTPSTDHLRSPQTPASSSKNKNFHPYLIQTSASAMLSRTNSSPVQPIYEGGPRHRVSRSMSALNKVDNLPHGVYASSGSSDAGSEDRTPGKGKGSPDVRKGIKRSGTLPSFPSMEDIKAKAKEPELPAEPKLWTPSELGRYLDKTLRNGGLNGEGASLPPLLIDDIKTWVLRHQKSGRAFLKGPESWTTATRPPPFLPLLTSISRRLRRSSLQSRLSASKNAQSNREDDLSPPSVLFEEDGDEKLSDEEIGQPMTGVRKMAHAFDAIYSSASDVSGDEQALRPQWTGESQRREGWKRWEADMKPLRRQNTGSSIGSIDELALPSLVPVSKPHEEVITEDIIESDLETDEDEGHIGTIKARPAPVEAATDSSSSATSPPPPYASPNLGTDQTPSPPRDSERSLPVTPLAPPTGSRSASHSVTPTTSREASTETQSPSVARLAARQSLGRSASRRLPKQDDTGAETDDERDHLRNASSHYSTARRVTIKASKPTISSIFSPGAPSSSSPAPAAVPVKSDREMDLEKQISEMGHRLKELEERLESVDKAMSASSSITTNESSSTFSSYLLGRLGLVSGDEGLPKSVGELPAYLFLVGFGVGAVVVRVLFTRR